MESDVTYQSNNVLPPYRNASGYMASQANFVINASGVDCALGQHLGRLNAGEFLTVQADGAKLYMQLAFGPSGWFGPIPNEEAQGSGPDVCWPIPNGQSMSFRVLGGQARGSGGMTMMPSPSLLNSYFIRAKTASGGGTGYLRVYKSSAPQSLGIEVLRGPGWKD